MIRMEKIYINLDLIIKKIQSQGSFRLYFFHQIFAFTYPILGNGIG